MKGSSLSFPSLLTKWLLSKGIEATFYYWIIMAGIIVAVFI